MKPFPILSPGDKGYLEAVSRAKRVFAGKEVGWRLADCDKIPDPEKTKVIFRKSKHEVLAIFPEEPATRDGHECTCYAHTGQHSACDPFISRRGYRLATPEEYAPLKAELERIGYTLHVVSVISPSMTRKRLANACH